MSNHRTEPDHPNRMRRELLAGAAAVVALGLRQTTAVAADEPRWRAGPVAPYATQEIYPALHGGEIWVAGGFSPQARGATERVIVLDPATWRWRDGPALPEPAHHVQLASVEGELYAMGGFLGGASRVSWICTPRVLRLAGERWVESAALPVPIAEAVPLVLDGRIHLVGGRSPRGADNATWNDHVDVAEHLVFQSGAWRRAAPLPMARNSHAGAVVKGALHMVSGRTVAAGPTPAHQVYLPNEDRWQQATPFPEPRGGLAAALWRGRLVAGGGEVFTPGSVGTTLWALQGERWVSIGSLPTPRHGHGFVTVADALVVIGGAEQPGARGALATVDILA
jgi:hypothetical protein